MNTYDDDVIIEGPSHVIDALIMAARLKGMHDVLEFCSQQDFASEGLPPYTKLTFGIFASLTDAEALRDLMRIAKRLKLKVEGEA